MSLSSCPRPILSYRCQGEGPPLPPTSTSSSNSPPATTPSSTKKHPTPHPPTVIFYVNLVREIILKYEDSQKRTLKYVNKPFSRIEEYMREENYLMRKTMVISYFLIFLKIFSLHLLCTAFVVEIKLKK